MNTLFPIFLKAEQLNFLIIGGGKVALEKLTFLKKSSPEAKVSLVAISILPEVEKIVSEFDNALLYCRAFSVDDLCEKHIVIAATANKELNLYLRDLADKYKFLLNVADTPQLCDFYLGGVVTKGDLKLAISTNGKAPILAKRLRETFESILPSSIEESIENLHQLRKKLTGDFDQKLKAMNEITKKLIDR